MFGDWTNQQFFNAIMLNYVQLNWSGIRDFKRNIGREAGFYSIAGIGINKNTMAICGEVIHD
jgi:hypothetical protein